MKKKVDKKEDIEKNVILINKMCTGSYTLNNIGHEIINYFKASDGNVYVYISPYGSMRDIYDNRIKTILLTSALSNHKIEIIAKIDEPEQEILFKKIKDKSPSEIHTEQVNKYSNIFYGGKTLEEIFENNYGNSEAIHITFKVNPKNMKKPKKGKHIYITNEKSYKNMKNDNNCTYITVDRNIARSSLKQYFEKQRDKKDYYTINQYLENEEWENFEPEELTEKTIKDDEKINFMQLIEKQDEEQIYTNMIWYWFSRENVFNSFLEFRKYGNLRDKYDIQKEKVISGGRTDILALGKNYIIIIENKIMSGINGVEKEKIESEYDIIKRTQLSKYIAGIKGKQENGELLKREEKDSNISDNRCIKGFVFIPDYREDDFYFEVDKYNERDILNKYYKVIKYSELYDFFTQKEIREVLEKDLYGKKYYADFINGLELHKQPNISEKNRIEMRRKFIYAIKHAKNNNK